MESSESGEDGIGEVIGLGGVCISKSPESNIESGDCRV
jgi:hypothetical protein